ncbi:uncharacterized protein LOC116322641 [Oreochromis aureus]|uniref:Uncharacterized protein n=1 Tax=Oreochromis aureus TaxID=47969 RepID=A0A668T4N8_OREAU|nr:uncharacterized protein LOC116322641 [Oreochromis aureus]
MAAAVNRPPLAPEGPSGANPHVRVNADVANSTQQDPGLHSTSQDPGPSSHPQHPVFARPLFYVHAPPLPPFLQYQWPLPYNPFPGFLGMGYGMVMPPLPPPPYLESPAYIVPHPQVQPVDYRRLLHPQAHSHAPGGSFQNLNQTRRIRLPHTTPVRETVNSEVQTEPIHRGGYDEGCPILSSDSGRATASNSPSSLSSSSQKQGSAEVETYMLASTEAKEQVKGAGTNRVKHGCHMAHPTGITVQSSRRETQEIQGCKDGAIQEPSLIPPCGNAHCNMWSVSSQDSMGPVCSSSQTEDEVKERRISVPDILSWGGGTSQKAMTTAAEALLQNNHEIQCYENEVESEKSVYQSPSKPKNYPVVVSSADDVDFEVISSSKDSEMVFKILRLPSLLEPFSLSTRDADSVEMLVKPCLSNGDEILQALNALRNGTENGSETHEEPTEITPKHTSLSRCQMNKNINESVWSVESLAPFIPTKEWLQQNSVFEPEVIVEMERAENSKWSTKKDDPIGKFSKERRQSSRFSSPDSVLVSESVLTFSTPAKKQSPPKNPDMVCETEVSETKGTEESHSTVPSEKYPLLSLTTLQGIILTASTDEDMNDHGSSEPEANRSPNQGTLIYEQEEKSSVERKETCLINSAAEDKVSSTSQMTLQNDTQMEVATAAQKVDGQMRNVELGVPTTDQKMAQVTPSKGNLVDCAIQCTELQGLKCLCKELKGGVGSNRKPQKYPDLKKANDGKAEAFCMQKNSKRNGQWRNRGPEKHNGQQEDCNGSGSRPGKLKGGSGRNPRY